MIRLPRSYDELVGWLMFWAICLAIYVGALSMFLGLFALIRAVFS